MKSTLSSACGHQGDDLDSLSFVQESLQDRSAANDALSVHVNPLMNELLEVSDCCKSTESVKWWDIVPPELEDESDKYSNSMNCSPTLSFKDEIDKSGLLEELKDLHENVERAGSRIDNRDSDPLFANSNICVKEFVILLLGIVTRHHLTSVALEDILELINIISPVENNVPKDTVEVYAFFEKHSKRIVKHFFCPNKKCQAYISNTSLQGKEKCKVCNMKVAEEAMFLEIPVQDQLKAVLSAPGVLDKLSYRFRRQKLSESAIEDVYDGHLYKQLSVENGFLSDPNNISLLGNTDGVSLVHSTRAGVWPVYYIINELPPIERFSRCNRLFAGIWFGKGKPHFPTFMKPFCESIKDLYLKGVKIDEESGTTIRGILLDTTMDAPARSSWLCIKQFNGYCGCPTCTEPGKQLDLGPGKKNSRRQCHIYPFNIEMAQSTGHAKRRTHNVVKKQAVAAMTQISQKGKVTNPLEGVLGLSWAFALPFHDVIAGTAVDYMHCICEGVVDQHLRAWFDDKSSENYLGGSLEEIDGQFLSLRPISEITRRPRSISDWKQWKANEKRAFLLYYCIPLLCGRLSDDSFMHLAFLVGGIYRLLKDSISEQDVLEASAFLKLYCAQAPRFYGDRFQTFNVHQVLHLKDAVQNLGPLWSNSCFPFEDFNGDLSGYFHGSQNIQGQIVKSICVHQSLPRLAETLTEGSVAKQFYKNLTSRNYRCRTVGEEISEGTFVVGSVERVWATSNLLTEQERAVVGPVLRVWVFKRAIINGIEYQSSLYKRTTARNNFTVVFKDRGKSHYGSVLKFLKWQAKCTSMQCSSKCSCSLPFFFIALVQKMRNHVTQLPSYKGIRVIQHVTRVTLGEVISIPLSAIKKKCMRIDLDSDIIFVTHMANNFEKD